MTLNEINNFYDHMLRIESFPRFWSKVALAGPDECWLWTAALTRGYGRFGWRGRNALAHRVIYEFCIGAIPEELTIDHLCRNRKCVNPTHMEPVTNLENMRRGIAGHINRAKTHCPKGHVYDMKTLHKSQNYWFRGCRKCSNERSRLHRERMAVK